jgi:hypothetical protein
VAEDPSGKRDVSAQLGCGTLILIAIIVAMFSGRGDVRDARAEIGALQDQVTRLEAKVDSVLLRLGAP